MRFCGVVLGPCKACFSGVVPATVLFLSQLVIEDKAEEINIRPSIN
jgi:hypothetical protein